MSLPIENVALNNLTVDSLENYSKLEIVLIYTQPDADFYFAHITLNYITNYSNFQAFKKSNIA